MTPKFKFIFLLLVITLINQKEGISHIVGSDDLRAEDEKNGKYVCYLQYKDGLFSYAGNISSGLRWGYGGCGKFSSGFRGSSIFYKNTEKAGDGDIVCFERGTKRML